MVWDHSGLWKLCKYQQKRSIWPEVIDFSDSGIYSPIWALLQENRKKKKQQKRECQETEIRSPLSLQPSHSPQNHSPCLKGSWAVGLKFLNVSVCFFGLCCAAKIKYLSDMRRLSSLCWVCWAFQQSSPLDWLFIFLLTSVFFLCKSTFFSFSWAARLQGGRKYLGRWSNYKVIIW